jgi:5,5'-dehydrodivanillate O-demethylase
MASATDTQQSNGSSAEADYTDFVHTGPGTLAGRYLRMFWQPVYLAADLLPGHAKPVRVMSEDFTLYRGEGGVAHAVAFRCAHRGTQLSTGWVEGDCIRCFYHGWKYDGTGQCVAMPAEDPGFPPKVQIRSYPTEEYLGLIFAYLGEGEPPPLPRFPEFEVEGVLEADSYVRACNFFNSLENTPDEVHVNFVHSNSQFTGAGLNESLPTITAEETDYGFDIYGARTNGAVRVTPFLMPNNRYINVPPGDPAESGWREYLSWRVPLDDETFRSFNLALIHLTGEAAERYRARRTQKAAEVAAYPSAEDVARQVLRGELRVHDVEHPSIVNVQDCVSQMGQGSIPDRAHERLGRSDVGIILLRKLWMRELQKLAEGQPIKRWTRPAQMAATSGV